MASEISSELNADLFEIEPKEAYSNVYTQGNNEIRNNARPELAETIDNIDEYDVVFVGYPIWWYTAPMAVYTFLESYDLSGKTVIPFCTSSNSDIEESMNAINTLCKNSTILEEFIANNTEDIQLWLTKIGMLK